MKEILKLLKKDFQEKLSQAKSREEIENLERKYLGKKGKISKLTEKITESPPEERRELGKAINELKEELQKKIEEKYQSISVSKYRDPETERLDVTLPGKKTPVGHLHPVTQTIQEIEDIFHKLGFIRRRYPEVETDWYAFEGLNMPKNHPARDIWETFYIEKDMVLTPHTSSGQIREMERVGWPVRMINISRCDRRQSDINHLPTFYQFEGLVIDERINITHLKGTLDFFVHEFFGNERAYRLRPYDFRFTEPSFEIDVTCSLCGGKGCHYCKDGWVELGGAGMVHPQVLKNGGLDPKKVSGFAFGWGVERAFMKKGNLNIDDIRILYQNDLRFLEQF